MVVGIERFGPDVEPPDEPVPGTWGTDGGAGGRGARMRTPGVVAERSARPVVVRRAARRG